LRKMTPERKKKMEELYAQSYKLTKRKEKALHEAMKISNILRWFRRIEHYFRKKWDKEDEPEKVRFD
jgi:hypothetical protein